jgi:hypothetical protein
MLAAAYGLCIEYLSCLPEEVLWEKIGPVGGFYADSTKLGLVLHQVDEAIHHGAEIAVLRDLYRAQHRADPPFVQAALRADAATIEELEAADPGLTARMIGSDPDLMVRAAATGRWDALPILASLGFAVNGSNGRGPIHHTAGDGRIEETRLLLELGADLSARDPVYGETPLGWARYFNRTEMVAFLEQFEKSV